MKKIFLLSFVLFSLIFISCGSTSSGGYDTWDLFYTDTDSFNGNSFTHYKKPYRNPFTVYLGENNGQKWLRITFRYTGSSWIFFKKAMIKNSDNELITFNIPYFDKKTDILSSGVEEYVDLYLSPEDAEKLEKILQKDNVVVTGKSSGKNISSKKGCC